jgi:glycerol transport system permease protein
MTIAQTTALPLQTTRAVAVKKDRNGLSWFITGLYILFLMIPVYWLIVISFKDNNEVMNSFSVLPQQPTLRNYKVIFTDYSWYVGYINSTIYVVMNMIFSVLLALPAAYAFSRYRFLGDKHIFFWFLTNRMAPASVFALPFFQLYSAFGLIDTHIAVALAHCLFNVPLAIWILEGFMSGVPKEIDETAYIDGYSFPKFFVKIFVPMIASGIGTHADDDICQTNLGHHDPHCFSDGHGLGRFGSGRCGDIDTWRARYLVCTQSHRQGLCPRSGLRRRDYGSLMDGLDTADGPVFRGYRVHAIGHGRVGIFLARRFAPFWGAAF